MAEITLDKNCTVCGLPAFSTGARGCLNHPVLEERKISEFFYVEVKPHICFYTVQEDMSYNAVMNEVYKLVEETETPCVVIGKHYRKNGYEIVYPESFARGIAEKQMRFFKEIKKEIQRDSNDD